MSDQGDYTDTIRSVLNSLPFTAPEVMGHKLEQLMDAAFGLLRSFGYEVRLVEVVPIASLAPSGAEGGASPVVNQAEPGPGPGDDGAAVSPARASIEEGE